MLTASGLSKEFGGRELFRNVTFELRPGRRIALVGGNGAGKTTLIEILVGMQEPDNGQVHMPKTERIGYLPQDLADSPSGTVIEEAMAGQEHVQELASRITELEHLIATAKGAEHERALNDYGEVQSRFEQMGGYAAEAEAYRVLAGLGFTATAAKQPLSELSGGWRMRAALARLLVAAPDVLILDEPTNHLDVDSVAWLEQHLANWPGALLFVSHDRDFIDAVAERVMELANGTASEYIGGFAEFVVQREERLAAVVAAASNQAKKVADVEKFIDRFRYKATKARQVQSRIKTLEKLDRIVVPTQKELAAKFAFPEPRRSARVVVEFDNASVGYDGEAILEHVNLVIERGRKVALVGPNGAGKTTLVRSLLGELAPIAGTITIGHNVDTARFEQHQAEVLDINRSGFQELLATVGDVGTRNLRTILGSFGFSGDGADRLIGDLSGGERTRLALAKTMVHPVNLLVLDEPTNHLDLPSCDLLEDALQAYPGTVILVTHDRHLIRGVADALVDVRDGKAVWYEGVDERVLTPANAANTPPAPKTRAADNRSSKNGGGSKKGKRAANDAGRSGSDPSAPAGGGKKKGGDSKGGAGGNNHHQVKELRRQLRAVEKKWQTAENKVAELQAKLADPAIYEQGDQVKELAREHDMAKDAAAKLATQWEQAATAVERASG